MVHELADRAGLVRAAEERLSAEIPRTEAWFAAQWAAVHMRAEYWAAANAIWDRDHPTPTVAPDQLRFI